MSFRLAVAQPEVKGDVAANGQRLRRAQQSLRSRWHPLARCRAGRDSLAVAEIDAADPRWEVPLRRTRPWRAEARKGEIYRSR